MRRAVVHLNVDPAGVLTLAELTRAVAALRASGLDVLDRDLDRLPPTQREIELLHEGDDLDELCRWAEAAGAAVLDLEVPPRAVAVAFLSAGTAEDALGIVAAFGFAAGPGDLDLVDDDVALLRLPAQALREPAVAKLQTALEAALNREVRVTAR